MVIPDKLIERLAGRPDQLQLFRYLDNGQRKIVIITEAEWETIVEALRYVQQETRK